MAEEFKEVENMTAEEKAEAIKSLEEELAAMDKARIAKVESGIESFIAQTKVASDRYLTINGYLQARDAIRAISWKELSETTVHTDALSLAEDMSELLVGILNKFQQQYGEDKEKFLENLNTFLTANNWHDPQFVKNHVTDSVYEYAREFLVCQALSNMAGLLDEIYCFNNGAIESAGKIDEKLEELKSAE